MKLIEINFVFLSIYLNIVISQMVVLHETEHNGIISSNHVTCEIYSIKFVEQKIQNICFSIFGKAGNASGALINKNNEHISIFCYEHEEYSKHKLMSVYKNETIACDIRIKDKEFVENICKKYDNFLIKHHVPIEFSDGIGEKMMLCKSKTKDDKGHTEWKIKKDRYNPDNCYMVIEEQDEVICKSRMKREVGQCAYKIGKLDEESNNILNPNMIKLTVSTGNTQKVSISSNTFVKSVICHNQCTFEIEQPSILTIHCENGNVLYLKKPDDTLTQCDYNLPYVKHVAKKICREIHKPNHFWLFITWLLFGRMVLISLSFIYSIIFSLMRKLTLKIQHKYIYGLKSSCKHCKENIDFNEEIRLHEDCANGRCPYCSSTVGLILLEGHIKKCPSKNTITQHVIVQVEDRLNNPNMVVRKINEIANSSKIHTSLWIMITIIFFFMLVNPTSAQEGESSIPKDKIGKFSYFMLNDKSSYTMISPFEKLIEDVEKCSDPCHWEYDKCFCKEEDDINENIRYKRSAINSSSATTEDVKIVTGVKEKKKLESSVDLKESNNKTDNEEKIDFSKILKLDNSQNKNIKTSSYGPLNIHIQKKTSDNLRDLSLTWSDAEEDGDSVILKGKGLAYMTLTAFSSMVWHLSHKKSSEKQKLVLTILEFSHEYKYSLDYWTLDRKIDMSSNPTCTGPCAKDCGCKVPTCAHRTWMNDRDWGCNPGYCLTISGGCSCCSTQPTSINAKYVVAVYTAEYVLTRYVLCTSISEGNQRCDVISSNKQIDIENFGTIMATSPTSQTKFLPKRIAIVEEISTVMSGTKKIKVPKHVIDAKEFCTNEICSHGQIGDFKAVNMFDLFNTASNKTTMKYNPDTFSRTCRFTNWPTCHYNVIEQNTKHFDVLFEKEKDIRSDFTVHQLTLNQENNGLIFRVRPNQGRGTINILLDINNLRLKQIKIKPKVSFLSLTSCTGCFNCVKGFICELTIALESPENFNLHLKSSDPEILINDVTYRVSQSKKTFLMKGFTTFNKQNFTICIEEAPTSCSHAKTDLKEEILLIQDTPMILENTYKDNKTCSGLSYFKCLARNSAGIFSVILDTVGTLYNILFGNWKTIIMIIGLIITILLLLWISPIIVTFMFKKRAIIELKKRRIKKL